MEETKLNVAVKITAIIAFTFIILSLILITQTPIANGYEISIYDVYPWYFWFFLITSIFLGQVIILKEIFLKASNENNRLWLISFLMILIPIIIVLFMPHIRGYLTYGRGDHLTHIGIIKDIVWVGGINTDNFYPNLHILTASLVQVCDFDVIHVANLTSRFFFFISPVSMYLLFRTIFKKRNETMFALLLASSFLFFGCFSKYLAQCPQSFLLIPLLLYLYLRRINSEKVIGFSILFIVFTTSYILYHPLNSILFTLVLFCLLIVLFIHPRFTGEYLKNQSSDGIKKKAINGILFPFFVFSAWYFSFSYIIGSFQKVFVSIFVDRGSGSIFEAQASAVSTYNPKILDILELAIYNYGLYIIMGMLSVFSLMFIFIKWYKNKKQFKIRFYALFSGLCFLIFGILSTGAFFADVIVGWERFIRWAVLFSFILISIIFYNILSGPNNKDNSFKVLNKKVKIFILCIFLISLLFLSTFTFYRSPMKGEVNLQVTNMEWGGVNWLLDNRNSTNLIQDFRINIFRFSDAIYGYERNILADLKILMALGENPGLPDHFGYNNDTSLGNYYGRNSYVILTHLGRIFYPVTYPDYIERWRFTPADFEKLQNDNTVVRIYDNCNFEVLLTKP
ncbi:MAG: hypothetical protein K8R68_06875 [Bacteroidales bacterium]|nr:hypothetical protein [Bacteroidales bacterium]